MIYIERLRMELPRFREDNTESYTPAQLATLEHEYEQRLRATGYWVPPEELDDLALGSVRDHIAEQVETDYASGLVRDIP